jgi:hypothetical protein
MTSQNALAAIQNPPAEESFFARLSSRTDPRLPVWAKKYHYFSLHQAHLLPNVLLALDPSDSESLCEVGKALFEELGSGHSLEVHSRLFASFARAVGVEPSSLPIPHTAVVPQVIGYLEEIRSAYVSGDIARVLGAYAFLERSAVLSYPVMLRALRKLGFAGEALVFFTTHVVQEAEHEKGALFMVQRLIGDTEAVAFMDQLIVMQRRWEAYWNAFV